MPSTTAIIQTLSISVSLIAAGGIATLSLFDVPELKSQPASRSLPSIRWLFSRGSHIFPQAAFVSCSGFLYLAYVSRAPGHTISQVFSLASSGKVNAYLGAAALCLSIGPFTRFAMIPTNFELIEMNRKRGGVRSEESARLKGRAGPSGDNAEGSVAGEGEAAEFTDLSGPQEKTGETTTKEEDEKVGVLLDRFAALNFTRAVLIGGGGVVGLLAALS